MWQRVMRVKVFITLDIDEEEYPIPADGQVGEEIEDGIREYFYDVEGADIKHMKTITESQMNINLNSNNKLRHLKRSPLDFIMRILIY